LGLNGHLENFPGKQTSFAACGTFAAPGFTGNQHLQGISYRSLDLNPAVNDSINRFIGDNADILLIFSAVLFVCGLALIATFFP